MRFAANMLAIVALVLPLVVAALPAFAAGTNGEVVSRSEGRRLIIVTGLGGESYYQELFQRWATSLYEVARERLALSPAQIVHLAPEHSPASAAFSGISTRDAVLAAIADAAAGGQPGDLVALVLIGHGSAQPSREGVRARFNLPGPDLSPQQLAKALDAIEDRVVVVVNSASASGPFLEPLSAPGRIVITATSSAAENQHARFAGHFVAAFADDAADADKDRQVSVLEAFTFATRAVTRDFKGEGLLQTEHAVLDDSGDGVGSRAPSADNGAGTDGALAARVILAVRDEDLGGDNQSARARLRLNLHARRLVDEVEALKRRKPSLEAGLYARRLEALLLELALNRRAYRMRQAP